MRTRRVLAICSILTMALTMAATTAVIANAQGQQGAPAAAPAVPGLTMTSTGFEDGGIIPHRFTQAAPNFVSPELKWTNVPPGVVSFVLILHDAEGAINKTTEDILHWMAFNIPGTVRELPEAVPADPRLPDGTIQAKNRRGNIGAWTAAGGSWGHWVLPAGAARRAPGTAGTR